MNYSNDHYLFSLNKINDFVWESFNEMFSCLFVFYRMDIRISFYKVYSRINLQKEIIS